MRIEKLELNKVKVTVFPFDLANMNISIKNLRPDSPQLHNFLFKVMERVQKETGFNPYSGQIVVEASPEGECIILTVTRVSDKTPRLTKNNINHKKIRAYIKDKKLSEGIYYFDDFDMFCKSLTNLSDDTIKKASYYRVEDSHILIIKVADDTEHIILREFCDKFEKNNSLRELFFKEHCQKYVEGEEFVAMAIGINRLYE